MGLTPPPIDLIPLPIDYKVNFEAKKRVKEMKKLHKQIRAHIEKIMSLTRPRPTRIEKELSTSQEILFGFTLERKDSLQGGKVS